MMQTATAPEAVMSEGPPEGQDDEQAQTVEVPLSAAPQAKPGAMLTLKVISIDQQGGVINAVVTPMEAQGGGSDEMAQEFDKPEEE